MLEQDRIRLTYQPSDQVIETKESLCQKHNLHFASKLIKVYTGTRWTECPECQNETRQKIIAGTIKSSLKPTRRVYSSFRKTSRKKAGA